MEYGFRYELYPGQRQLVEDVSGVIEKGGVCVVSSPTGTGKTLSLLCTAIRFMKPPGDDDLYALLNTRSKTTIYYCSRTHSQLSQVLHELRRNKNRFGTVILGSRKQYCINRTVSAIQDSHLLNERCREMVSRDSCEFYGSQFYTDDIMDLEDLRAKGKEQGFCPYFYASEKAHECEIVLLPYNLLFTEEGRKSLGLSLEKKILIIDEAHNIYDAVTQINSAEIAWADIKRISLINGLSEDLVVIIQRLQDYAKMVGDSTAPDCGIQHERVIPVLEFLVQSKLSSFNMLEVEESMIAAKLAQKNDMPVIFDLMKFLRLLTFSDETGRIIVSFKKIRFTPVKPTLYFQELSHCRAVVFAGGTMEPISQLRSVFPTLEYFCYPPVSTDFISLILSEGVSGQRIALDYGSRDGAVDDLVNTLVMLSNPIRTGGVVFFVQSKAFLAKIKASQKTAFFKRRVLYEGESTFEEFQRSPDILFAVMGGRLSEGINFSDSLCRLLVVVGIPYPTRSVEFDERVRMDRDYAVVSAMRVVNQTIGRAIRHKDDYAAIVLFDARFPSLKSRLSGWVQGQTKEAKPVECLLKIGAFLKKTRLL